MPQPEPTPRATPGPTAHWAPEAAAPDLDALRRAIRDATRTDEPECVRHLLGAHGFSDEARARIVTRAGDLVRASRAMRHERGTLDAFLHEFGLSSQEGVALMCLAEALLRIPNTEVADELISEKIASGDWARHRGRSESGFVNASTWALMLTGRVIELDSEITADAGGWLRRLVKRSGEPVIRTALLTAMRIMGAQFVMGRTIDEALTRAARGAAPNVTHSFDMLGEGARTSTAAERYFEAYRHAISRIGAAAEGDDIDARPGISVKLSALHPRYEFAKMGRLETELAPRLKALALAAAKRKVGLTIDAEEADRLEPMLDLFERLVRDADLAGWHGLGLAVQAYQKRAPAVIDWLIALARSRGRRLTVRLVKGAYWDSEVKHAQELGLEDYPVFTRKPATDLCYLHCAEKLAGATDVLYPQFATHNAHTIAAVLELMAGGGAFEFQRLHGMGELLYRALDQSITPPPRCRIYAPVGAHEDLLPYLVRRLLENGVNSSFVNRFMDAEVPVEEVVADPIAVIERTGPTRHARIQPPPALYGAERVNSRGLDLAHPDVTARLLADMNAARAQPAGAAPIIAGEAGTGEAHKITNPARREVVGTCIDANADDIERALGLATAAQADWDRQGGATRARVLRAMADGLESQRTELMALIVAEAGKTIADALAEVREAVDFCRYYACEAERRFGQPMELPGPTGERNQLSLHGRGVFACISPWNFPLAIFTGQVAAALAAGNTVIAKPAEQTPLIAAAAVRLFLDAGVPGDVLHLLPGDGETVGAALVGDERISGIAFTGATETAQAINRTLAARSGPIVPLIAETGGQNAMIVDSTALPEQVTDDVVRSAFFSAGQRCSALRVLFVEEDIADKLLEMIAGAMEELQIGDPAELATDIGPVIDEAARATLDAHVKRLAREARLIKACTLPDTCRDGTFFAPHLFEIDTLSTLTREVFGPIVHVIRFAGDRLDQVIDQIRATGYGLTLGLHSRIEARARYVFERAHVGNTYVNRNMVGAVVGVQPFGGEGLSGTGPKAGGPHYLLRFATERTLTVNTAATGGNAQLFCLDEE